MIQNQRERILAAVADVTAAKGYVAMSVEGIVESAGVSRRTFYDHFGNKEEAFLAAYDAVVSQLLDGVRDAYEEQEGFAERVRAGLEAFLALTASDPAFARMGIVEVLAAGPEAIRRRNEAMRAFAELIEDDARALGDERPPPLIAEAIVGAVYGVTYTRILDGRTMELPGLLPELVYLTLLPYLGQATAAAGRKRVAKRAPPARSSRSL